MVFIHSVRHGCVVSGLGLLFLRKISVGAEAPCSRLGKSRMRFEEAGKQRENHLDEVDTLFWTPFLRENKTPAKKRCLDEQTTIETVYPRVQGSSS
uniref:Uncharacterized protein n=1 Tax=Magnetococcus massalia (strain MO-1) TaxID=451514 RepID=A0A1S7LBZ8_MAGMO|nr:protein of unknown function [Candidatus Magnetococcus massalia]